MYTYNDLVAALQSGVSVEDIAAQMSKDLNAAKAEYDRLTAEKAEAARKTRKRDLVYGFYSALGMYVTEFYPDSVIAEMIATAGTPTDEDLDSFAEQMDNLVETFEAMKNLTELLDTPHITAHKVPETISKDTSSDALEDFLNKFVR